MAPGREEERIRRAYAAFNARDIDGALALMHPDVEWPNGMEGGIERGHAAVRAYWTRQWTMIDPHVEPLAVRHDPAGGWVVEVHQVVRARDGSLLADRRIRHVYALDEDGLIRRMEIQEDAAA